MNHEDLVGLLTVIYDFAFAPAIFYLFLRVVRVLERSSVNNKSDDKKDD